MTPPLPDPAKTFWQQSEDVLLACCLFGEARGESFDAKVGVACVVRNRVHQNLRYMGGASFAGVILQPYQFSSFNFSDPNRGKLLRPLMHESPNIWAECYRAACAVYKGNCPDVTNGALFYFSPPLIEAPHAWGKVSLCCKLGSLSFYKPSPAIETHAA